MRRSRPGGLLMICPVTWALLLPDVTLMSHFLGHHGLMASAIPAVGAAAHLGSQWAAAHGMGAAGAAAAAKAGFIGHAAAGVHATAAGAQASLAGLAATGASAAMKVAPDAFTQSLRAPDQKPNSRAVGRILQIEWERFQVAWHVLSRSGQGPIEVATQMLDKARNREPIIRWALGIWIRGKVGLEGAGQKGLTIISSLRALELEIAAQLKFGLQTAPWRVVRLACSAFMLTLLAVLARIPGCEPLNRRLCKLWPKTVEQLSAVMERNFQEDPSRSLESTTPERTRWQRIRDKVLPPHAPPILEFPKDLLTSMFGEPFFDPAAVPASKAANAADGPVQPMIQPT